MKNIYTYDKTNKTPKFKIGDLVRISLKRRPIFDKPSANIKWSEELFKIHSINKSNVITYKIKDLNDEIIEGIFYQQELQKSKNTSEVYIIEKIIRKNKNKYLVKWRNYSNEFNSWIDKDDIIRYTLTCHFQICNQQKTCHHNYYESAKIIKNMSFLNMQLIKNMSS